MFFQQGYLSKPGAKSFRLFQVPYLLGVVFQFFHLYSAPTGRASPGSVGLCWFYTDWHLVMWEEATHRSDFSFFAAVRCWEPGPGRNFLPPGSAHHTFQDSLFFRTWCILYLFTSRQWKDKTSVSIKACPSRSFSYFSLCLHVLSSFKISSTVEILSLN